MKLVETSKYSDIEPFLRGEGVMRRVAGGSKAMLSPKDVIANPMNYFLLVYDDVKPVGFVCFYPHDKSGGYDIHVCLRTVGKKTKRAIAMAISYARMCLYARSIYAIYPKSARAVTALCRHFGFRIDKVSEGAIQSNFTEPYAFERLDLV